jgi:sporulation protein YlmC with PRC-barrel domain
MKRSVNELIGCAVHATGGDMGRVAEFYFDDHHWTIRYMVVDTERWLVGRRVLIATTALLTPAWHARTFPVSLTQQQVKDSPDIDTDKPVSRRHEEQLHAYYGWPAYWAEAPYGVPVYPMHVPPPVLPPGDPHLRSTKRVTGYHIQATDGEIGHVEDFIIDDDTWTVRYLVVSTRDWLFGKRVLLSPWWIKAVRWEDQTVVVDLTRAFIQNAPAFDPAQPLNRDYENRLFNFYKRPKYWEEPVPPVELRELHDGTLLAVRLTGKLVKDDYEQLLPVVERLVKQHGQIRMLVELHDFHGWTMGAAWEDTKFALHHFHDIERLALVGETKWEQAMATFCRPFTKAEVRYFDHTQAAAAREWVAAGMHSAPGRTP